MKKLLYFVICFIISTFAFSANVFGETYTKTFKISAYYSPLPCQNNYATGTYEGDIRLNGRGTNGADGTEVYPGMLAAPSVYSFGTKIYIPGLGTGTVHDRGGAIVSASGIEGSYDRLDVWMGYGDVGLKRALNWGKRVVDATVYGVDSSIPDDLYLAGFSTYESIPNECLSEITDVVISNPQPLVVETETPIEITPEPEPVFNKESFEEDGKLEPGSSGEEVRKLQEELRRLNFYWYDVTGYYGELTAHAVFKFQQSQFLVGDKDSLGAGLFGPKTKARLNDIIAIREFNNVLIAEANSVLLADNSSDSNDYLNTELDFGAVSTDVELLQKFLKNEGYFEGSFITNYFGEITKVSLMKFQLDHKIINDLGDPGAGRVGPATLKLINSMS
ncbi:hypothetical protein GF354_03730 [Candidatus Peregrinibacteria bacterium]|nr:hypothetical protein [Candidatus Peregrinibacteria bacterium]